MHSEPKAEVHGASMHCKLSTESKLINLSISYFTTYSKHQVQLEFSNLCNMYNFRKIRIQLIIIHHLKLDPVFSYCPMEEMGSMPLNLSHNTRYVENDKICLAFSAVWRRRMVVSGSIQLRPFSGLGSTRGLKDQRSPTWEAVWRLEITT